MSGENQPTLLGLASNRKVSGFFAFVKESDARGQDQEQEVKMIEGILVGLLIVALIFFGINKLGDFIERNS